MVEVGERYADFRGVMIRGYSEVIEDPAIVKENHAPGRRRFNRSSSFRGSHERIKAGRSQHYAIQNFELGTTLSSPANNDAGS